MKYYDTVDKKLVLGMIQKHIDEVEDDIRRLNIFDDGDYRRGVVDNLYVTKELLNEMKQEIEKETA